MQSKGYADESAKGVGGMGADVFACICVWYDKGAYKHFLIFQVLLCMAWWWPELQPAV